MLSIHNINNNNNKLLCKLINIKFHIIMQMNQNFILNKHY